MKVGGSLSPRFAAVLGLTLCALCSASPPSGAQLFLSEEEAFERCTKRSKEYTTEQVIRACEKTLKSDEWNATTYVWAHYKLGEAYRKLKDFRKSEEHLQVIVDEGWRNESTATAACAASYWLQDWDMVVEACDYMMDEEISGAGWRLALRRKAVAYKNLGRYYRLLKEVEEHPRELEYFKYAALKGSGRSREAEQELERLKEDNVDISQEDAEEKEQTVIKETKNAGTSRVAVISYCPSLDIVGTAVSSDPMKASVKAYKDCVSNQLSPIATECCTIVAQADISTCVAVVRSRIGLLFISQNTQPSSAAKAAMTKCGDDDCKPVATKCTTDGS